VGPEHPHEVTAGSRKFTTGLGVSKAVLGRVPQDETRENPADVVLFPTLIRMELVYGPLFGCGGTPLWSLPALWRWRQRFFALEGETVTLDALRGLNIASGSGRPAFVALGAAREAIREGYVVIAPDPVSALRLQVAGVRGAIAIAGGLDLAAATVLASLAPEAILAVAPGTASTETSVPPRC
jgi:hypothetical protein